MRRGLLSSSSVAALGEIPEAPKVELSWNGGGNRSVVVYRRETDFVDKHAPMVLPPSVYEEAERRGIDLTIYQRRDQVTLTATARR